MTLYEEILSNFHIQPGERIWLSSELLKFALLFKSRGVLFDPSALLDTVQDLLGREGTLLLPTFCFDFSNTRRYDYLHARGNTGVLGNTALQRGDFIRTQHPMHSFAVWGKDAQSLYAMQNKHAFGIDSPFEYCREKNVRQIMLGTDYVHAMTFIHYAEAMCQVPYRFAKSFTGIYITPDGRQEERTYDYAARRLDVGTVEQFNRMGAVLERSKIAYTVDYEGIVSHVVMLGDSYEAICKDIQFNMCRNIYDFSIPREKLFQGFGG